MPSGELSQSTALAICSGVPMRDNRILRRHRFLCVGLALAEGRSNVSVWIVPGETLLTRTPCLANSSAAVLVRPLTANLLAT
jgi:hypothetical protein